VRSGGITLQHSAPPFRQGATGAAEAEAVVQREHQVDPCTSKHLVSHTSRSNSGRSRRRCRAAALSALRRALPAAMRQPPWAARVGPGRVGPRRSTCSTIYTFIRDLPQIYPGHHFQAAEFEHFRLTEALRCSSRRGSPRAPSHARGYKSVQSTIHWRKKQWYRSRAIRSASLRRCGPSSATRLVRSSLRPEPVSSRRSSLGSTHASATSTPPRRGEHRFDR
jgi:hypothetical protein